MQEIVDSINGLVWSEALIFLCLGAGLFFSVLTRFVQVRLFREMIRLIFSGKSSERGRLAVRPRWPRKHCRRRRRDRIWRPGRRFLDVGRRVSRCCDSLC